MSHLNIEIKARCHNPGEVRQILEERNADFRGVDHQIDTYFKCREGRLKLREGNIERALIHYQREDKPGPKKAHVTLFHPPENSTLKEILEKSLGILVVVDKEREIYFIENVKFHIDKVRGLGSFMEIEAIDKDGTMGEEKIREQCRTYLELFRINEKDLLTCSYSDMLMEK